MPCFVVMALCGQIKYTCIFTIITLTFLIIIYNEWRGKINTVLWQMFANIWIKKAIKRYSVPLCLQLFVGGIMSYLRYLSLLVYSCVQHILCCALVLFFFLLCTLCCQFLWIVLFWLPLSVFSTVYLRNHRRFKYDLCISISRFSYQNPGLGTITQGLISNVLQWQFPQYNNESEMYIQLNVGFSFDNFHGSSRKKNVLRDFMLAGTGDNSTYIV